MSDAKISDLPSSTGVTPASDFIPIVHSGTTEKITPNELIGGLGLATDAELAAGLATKADVLNPVPSYANTALIPATYTGVARVGTDLYVGDGVNLSKEVSSVYLIPDLTASATANVATLQSAVTNGGTVKVLIPGVYYVNDTVILPSNTTIEIGAGVELRATGSTVFNFFRNSLYTPNLEAITSITYVSTARTLLKKAVATYTNTPQVAVGDWVLVDGDTTLAGNGPWQVTAVNTATKVVNWQIPGGVAPVSAVGTLKASKANINITVTGAGTINGNIDGSGGTLVPEEIVTNHAIVFNNVINPVVCGKEGKLLFLDIAQYAVLMCRVSTPYCSDIHCITSKDGVHYFGPVFGNAVIRNMSGAYGDDCAIFDNYSGSFYAALMPPNCGGSFYQGGLMENINVVRAGNAGAAGLYPARSPGAAFIGTSNWRMYGRYDFRNISRMYPLGSGNPGNAVFVGVGYSTDVSEVDEIYIDGVLGGVVMNNAPAAKLMLIDKITIKNCASNKLNDNSGVVLGYLKSTQVNIDINCYFQGSSASFAVELVANTTINSLSISGKLDSTASTSGLYALRSVNSATVNTIDFHDIVLVGGGYASIHDFTTTSFANTPMLSYRNIDSTDGGYCMGFGGGNYNVNVDNLTYGLTQPFNFYGGASNISFRNVFASTGTFPFINTSCKILNATPTIVNVSRVAQTTGSTLTIANWYGVTRKIIAGSPAGSLAALTLALPTTPIDGEVLELNFIHQITNLTVTNGTIQGLPTGGTVAAGFGGTWRYSLADTLWIRYT